MIANYHNIYKIGPFQRNMKKGILLVVVIVCLLVLPSVSALQVEKIDKGSVVIAELSNPAIFDFAITSAEADTFEIYSFLDVTFSPRGTFDLPVGKSTTEIKVYPGKDLRRNLGVYKFQYELKGQKSGIFKDFLAIRIVELGSVITINAEPLKPSDKQLAFSLKNNENTNVDNMDVHLESAFFNFDKKISLKPYEKVDFNITMDRNKTASLLAGKYIITANVQLEKAKAKVEGILDYFEENSISVDKTSSGIVVRKNVITKTNTGNVQAKAAIDIKKDVLSRLFTVYSIEPMTSDRKGLTVNYLWEKTLNPGEAFAVTSSTNYTLPLILIILVVLVIVFAKIYSLQALSVSKRVSYVKTKGGQFALKVTLHVKAGKHTDNIQIIDKLPEMTKIYEKYGRLPDRIDHATRRLFWNIPRLNAGEERVFSYILYSNLNIVGRFELPAASDIFEREGKSVEVFSNRAFFAIATTKREY